MKFHQTQTDHEHETVLRVSKQLREALETHNLDENNAKGNSFSQNWPDNETNESKLP